MFITNEKFRVIPAKLLDVDLVAWQSVYHESPFSFFHVCVEIEAISEGGAVEAVRRWIFIYHPWTLDQLIENREGRGRVLGVVLNSVQNENSVHYTSKRIQRILRFKKNSGRLSYIFEIEDKGTYYSDKPPATGDKIEIVYDFASLSFQ